MVRHLILMRHGDALPTNPGGDRARELSTKGREDVADIAKVFVASAVRPSLLLHSPFKRTVQTASILADSIGATNVMTSSPVLASGQPLEPMIREIEAFKTESLLMVIAHMPDVGELGSEFGNMSLGQQYAFVPAGIACLRFKGDIVVGQGEVVFLSRPIETPSLSEKLNLLTHG